MQDAPYLLEPLAQQFADEEVPVRLALLTAALKLFFARPPECQTLLGAALAAAVADADQDVRDRGLMYYRRTIIASFACSCSPLPCCILCTPIAVMPRAKGASFSCIRPLASNYQCSRPDRHRRALSLSAGHECRTNACCLLLALAAIHCHALAPSC